ncbi:MAG: 1-deoxy-D-xylulose-5-phosphate synthase, partial [Clostridiales Family XIII bacterium]|nr:1-deoxy-D-xylulose-5-phosphate synthase [Clostridiales Family XIII bacterium]
TLRPGADAALLAVGGMTPVALEAAGLLAEAGIDARVIDVFKVKPLDEEKIAELASGGMPLVTLEDNVRSGGFGEKLASVLETRGFTNRLHIISWPDKFLTHGSVADLIQVDGLDAGGVAATVRAFIP